jgi:formylglycine-generating enzyme required for sulfatase activity
MYLFAASCLICLIFSLSTAAYAEDLAEPPPFWHSPSLVSTNLVNLSTGEFTMGCLAERDAPASFCPIINLPPRPVKVKAFAIGRYEVSIAEWQQCVQAGACPPIKQATDNDRLPVTDVSFEDVQGYIAWLNAKTGEQYRLPSEAEWEYAARANSEAAYPWGQQISCEQAHYDRDACQRTALAPVDDYRANAWGLKGTVGNAWEWVADCWHPNYEYAPRQASAWTAGCDASDIGVVRGGSYILKAAEVRTLSRKAVKKTERQALLGFRLAKSL